jgi:SWI/SNF-related matrix-associated actin-dependent regulator of chromatin subfamily B member 1
MLIGWGIGAGYGLNASKEHIISIKLDLEWNNHYFKDCFQWDLTNPDNVPEEFASVLVNDMKLPMIFNTLIASSIKK